MPEDVNSQSRQALRLTRIRIGVLSTLLVAVLLVFSYLLGFTEIQVLIRSLGGMLVCVVVFFVLFRTGLNLRMRDPSMTMAQIVAASFVITYVVYQANDVRLIFL